ncbi:MAG TPA: NAD(P)-dependent oxidoreductase [Rhizomicrobium sp.]|jgi:precorrin-2 dehydrogenase/sirohydrochlorin ferrochelatase
MLPIILDPPKLKTGLAGRGEPLARRAALLAEAGVATRFLSPDVSDEVLAPLHLLFVTGLPEGEARLLAGRARALGVLVNVEDVLPLCDFHVPAIVRQGDLLLTASTGGKLPALARQVREHLMKSFGPEWRARVDALGKARAKLRSQGLPPEAVSRKVRQLVVEQGWL